MGRSSGLIEFAPAVESTAERCRVALYDRADSPSAAANPTASAPVEHPTLFARSVEWRSGELPGRARLCLDTLDRIDPAPRLSFRAGGGAAQLHRVGRRVSLTLVPGNLPLFHGTVVHQETDLAADRIEYTALDDRWLLAGVPVYGCIVASPIDGSLTYAQGWPLVFNPDGLKNCRDVNGRPVFTHTAEWNAPAAVDELPAPGEALAAARHWTVADVLQYLRFAYFAADSAALFADFPWMLRAQSFAAQLDWPAELHLALTPGHPADPADALNKTPRHLDLDGLDLCAVLQRTLQAAGPYSFDLHPAENGVSRLTLVLEDSAARNTDDDDGAIDLPRPLYLQSQTDPPTPATRPPAPGLAGGVHHLDLETAFQSTVTLGDRVRLESRFTQTGPASGDLLPAWDSAEETEFKNFLAAAADPIDALHSAMRRWPRVGQAYRIHPAAAALDAGGIFAAIARVFCSRTPDAHLSSTDPTPDLLKRVLRMPIAVEAQEIGGGVWHPALIADGLTLDHLGTIYLPGLLLADGHRSNHNGAFDSALQFRNLRINCAVPLDHALTYVVAAADAAVALPGNPGEAAGEPQGFGGSLHTRAPRAAAWIAPGLRRQHAARTRNQYRHEYRYDAWPIQATAGGVAQSGLYRSDLDALGRAAQEQARELLDPRIAFAPELAGITPALHPGLVIRRVIEEPEALGGAGAVDTGASNPLTATSPTPASPLTQIDAVIHRVVFDFFPTPVTRVFST